jgi:hypothetical protein
MSANAPDGYKMRDQIFESARLIIDRVLSAANINFMSVSFTSVKSIDVYMSVCMYAPPKKKKKKKRAALIDLGFQKDTCETLLIPFLKKHLPSIQALLDQACTYIALKLDVL